MFPTMRYLYSFRYRSNLDKSKEKKQAWNVRTPYGKIRSSQNFVTLHYHKNISDLIGKEKRRISDISYFIA